ncbi:MAG TPA: hypothetical protein VFZ28_02885 [Burkholderiaceae bacterium]|nr:hypothetical protein [Burkholderiaceae bacterium]
MNNIALAIGVACIAAMSSSVAAADAKPVQKKPVLLDLSSESLIDADHARSVVAEAIPAAVWKLYPPRKWGFFSQVSGGFTSDKICVVTARVMLAPLTVTSGIIMRPAERAMAFDARPNATQEECRAIAKAKLREATDAVVSSVVRQ